MGNINIYFRGKLIHATESDSLGEVRSNIMVVPQSSAYRMRKVVINGSWGEFALSDEANTLIYNETGRHGKDLERDDPTLVRIVSFLGERANAMESRLKVVEIPEEINWKIEEHEGKERVIELTRSWS